MCGIDFVTPFQGLNLFVGHGTQGVALGCLVLRFQRANWRPEGPEQKGSGAERSNASIKASMNTNKHESRAVKSATGIRQPTI